MEKFKKKTEALWIATAEVKEEHLAAKRKAAELSDYIGGDLKDKWFSVATEWMETLIRGSPEALAFAACLYWDCFPLSVKDIKKLTGCSSTEIRRGFPRFKNFTCGKCGTVATYPRQRTLRAPPALCEKCDQEHKAERFIAARVDCANWERNVRLKIKREAAMLEKLQTMPYDEYLRTDHWNAVRKRAYRKAGWKCSLCGDNGKLHCHHRDYERRGEERANDVTILCEDCHRKFHNIQQPKTDF